MELNTMEKFPNRHFPHCSNKLAFFEENVHKVTHGESDPQLPGWKPDVPTARRWGRLFVLLPLLMRTPCLTLRVTTRRVANR